MVGKTLEELPNAAEPDGNAAVTVLAENPFDRVLTGNPTEEPLAGTAAAAALAGNLVEAVLTGKALLAIFPELSMEFVREDWGGFTNLGVKVGMSSGDIGIDPPADISLLRLCDRTEFISWLTLLSLMLLTLCVSEGKLRHECNNNAKIIEGT